MAAGPEGLGRACARSYDRLGGSPTRGDGARAAGRPARYTPENAKNPLWPRQLGHGWRAGAVREQHSVALAILQGCGLLCMAVGARWAAAGGVRDYLSGSCHARKKCPPPPSRTSQTGWGMMPCGALAQETTYIKPCVGWLPQSMRFWGAALVGAITQNW